MKHVESQHKEKEKKEEYYTFIGTWSWTCYATSEEDAIRQYHNTYNEDLGIGPYEEIIKEKGKEK